MAALLQRIGKMIPAEPLKMGKLGGGKIAGEHRGQQEQQRIRQLPQKAGYQREHPLVCLCGQRAAGTDDVLCPAGKGVSGAVRQKQRKLLGPPAKGIECPGQRVHNCRKLVVEPSGLCGQRLCQQPEQCCQQQKYACDAHSGAETAAQRKAALQETDQGGQCGGNADAQQYRENQRQQVFQREQKQSNAGGRQEQLPVFPGNIHDGPPIV